MTTTGLDGLVLAVAGLSRLGWTDRIAEILPPEEWIPAPGQGALAVEARTDDRHLQALAEAVDHPESRAAWRAESAFSAALGGDCNLPLGAFARVRSGRIDLAGEVFAEDGSDRRRVRLEGSADEPERLGRRAADRVRRDAGRLGARARSR
jgi:hydroxymethylbilane synthase